MKSGPPSWMQELKLAEAHATAGRLADAEAVLRQILKADPNQADALNALASFAASAGKLDIAIALQEHASAARPKAAVFRANLAEMYRRRADALPAAEAEAALRRALELAPERGDVANALGLMLAAAGRQQDALPFLERAAVASGAAELWNNVGTVLKELGRFDEALAAFDRASARDPRLAAPLLGVAEVKTFRDGADAHLARMEALAGDAAALAPEQRTYLHFALGKAYDDLGRTDDAFAQLSAGNALKRGSVGYDEAAALALFERLERAFDAAVVQSPRGGSADQAPIFVIGMPRSGTTLVEQIISSHRDVGAAGEISAMNVAVGAGFPEATRDWRDEAFARVAEAYLRTLRAFGPKVARVTDKTPSNMYFVGLIHLMLPNAAIVHVRRDPVDTCFSCYSKLFTREMGQTYDLGELGRYYRAYHGLMRHWDEVLPAGRVLSVRYEDVVADIEGQARRLLAHCGLGWDERVLEFQRNERAVSTASASQVRQPIYASSVARWRPYEAHLGPLIEALGDLVES